MQLLWVENHAGFVRSAGKAFLSALSLTVVPSVAAAKVASARNNSMPCSWTMTWMMERVPV